MKISVIYIVLADKCGQYIGRKVLQDVQLFRVSNVFPSKFSKIDVQLVRPVCRRIRRAREDSPVAVVGQ